MADCVFCKSSFVQSRTDQRYCSNRCKCSAHRAGITLYKTTYKISLTKVKCAECGKIFETAAPNKKFCSPRCRERLHHIATRTRIMTNRAATGRLRPEQSHSHRGPYTPSEIAALRADPFCILPDRGLRAQWRKCKLLGIKRDRSLQIIPPYEVTRQFRLNKSHELRKACNFRADFRRRVRKAPLPVLRELRALAHNYWNAEDLVLEGFATVLRFAIPAAEAFKIAKAEVNRTSAQPFREQSFNPDIDYAARETGRQVSRASDIRAARGDG